MDTASEEGDGICLVPKDLLQHIPMLDDTRPLEPEVIDGGEGYTRRRQLEVHCAEALTAEYGLVGRGHPRRIKARGKELNSYFPALTRGWVVLDVFSERA